MNRSLLLSLSAFILSAAACSSTTIEPENSHELKWLGECLSDAECASAYSCLCGVCSLSCASADHCIELGSNASCFEPGQTATADCISALANQPGICVSGCSYAEPCEGSDSCIEGSCVPILARDELGVVDAGYGNALLADASRPVPNPAVGDGLGESCCGSLGQCFATADLGGLSEAGWTECADSISVCLPETFVAYFDGTDSTNNLICSTDMLGNRGNTGRCVDTCFIADGLSAAELARIGQTDCPSGKICVPCESQGTPTGICGVPRDASATSDASATRDATSG